MNKTSVDDMLIEMITPQVKAIEEKFSRGDSLTQTDIHTLLLKSQFNHINHLDQKMNEITASVVALEGRFDQKFNELENRFDKKFNELENRMFGLEGKFEGLEGKFQVFKAEMTAEFEKRIGSLELKIEQGQVKTQETIVSTMKWYIGGAGIVLIILKTLDLFIK